jgi:hypothetical protein
MRRSEAMVKKDEFTDEAWARIAPLLPKMDDAAASGATTARW